MRLLRDEWKATACCMVAAGVAWWGGLAGWFGVTPTVKRIVVPLVVESIPLTAVGDGSVQAIVSDYGQWIGGIDAGKEQAQSVVGVEAVVYAPEQLVVATGDCADIPAWFPASIAWRESRCTRGIDTGNGYYGYAQVARFHWEAGGVCDGLSWLVPSEEDECISRLWRDGAGASHWGMG